MNNNFKMIETGKILQDTKHCVFVSIFCRNAKPYKKYYEVDGQNTTIPLILMQERWDGTKGFPGGKVDFTDYIYIEQNKSPQVTENVLKNALIREMQEEINMKPEWIDKQKLTPLTTFSDGNTSIHNFSYEVNEELFIKIFKNSVNSQHILSENNGSIACHVAKYKNNKGLPLFLQNQFCATSKLELEYLIQKENLLQIYG